MLREIIIMIIFIIIFLLNNFAFSGLYERACEWKLSPAQSVTALACVNSVLSPIALCATSDR